MAPLTLSFLLILLCTGIPGADAESTANIIIAPKGGSVTIPCHYEDRNKTGVKYWCRGYYWGSCTSVIRTDSSQNGRVFIRDNATQLVFTVTVRNLVVDDSDYYWCGVESDVDPAAGESFYLSVRDPASESTNNWIEVQEGGSVVITDHYEDTYRAYSKFWCAGRTVDPCTTIVRTDSEEGDVSVRDDPNQQVFIVTLKNLKKESFGYYWSGVNTYDSSVVRASFYLQVTGGSYTLTTVDRMQVQKGGSVTIPCLYEDRYKTNVKYWCKLSRGQCHFKIRNDSPLRRRKVSIIDDPAHRVFTAVMENLTNEDSSFYQCGVETSKFTEDNVFLYLSVTDGTPELTVDKQEVTAVEGGTVTVQCRYSDSRSPKKWCKIGGSCVARNSGTLDKRFVQIADDKKQKIMRVTLEGLEMNDTAWYWCGTEFLQVPVHIRVTQKTKTTKASIMLNDLTPGGNEEMKIPDSGSWVLPVLLMILGVLVLLTVVVVSWKVWSRHRETRATDQGKRKSGSSSTANPELQYEEINTNRSAPPVSTITYCYFLPPDSFSPNTYHGEMNYSRPSYFFPQSSVDYADDVTYTSVAFSNSGESAACPSHQRASIIADDVIYSAVVQEHKKHLVQVLPDETKEHSYEHHRR
ncbi:polymeric immunoglobulin receptor-like isoform X2 [Scleropages formosus]|uniref:polymeric immunoglobulin receptor-like isoform X2 n=1 Tax=Scleropages formosus TaxID=113540 RepID=UPI0010FAB78E|nr:polymeric immunoglobulin receptor-like isoform X2 [Scleropages formosus]